MPEAVSYAVQEELMKQARPVDDNPATPIVPTDEERYLLRSYDHWQITTDLRNWHTFIPEDRIAKVQRLAAMPLKQLDQDKSVAADKRKRYLLFILMREVNHPAGKWGVAQIAFEALNPHPPKKKE